MGVRAHPLNYGRWWDATWNTTFGCKPLSPGCLNCYAARAAGTLQTATDMPLYLGTTDEKGGRYVFNGNLKVLPPEDYSGWTWPLRWKGAASPLLGPGMPSLLWAASMSELFLPGRPRSILDRTIGTLAISPHIGLILAKPVRQMVAYIDGQLASVQQRWREKLWLGFSAENQVWFDLRWPPMRELAQRSWVVFVSIAPMLGPVRLPDDFLALARWVICSGEEGLQEHLHYMEHAWPLAVRDQCAAAGIPFFMKQMAGEKPIPPALLVREFPAW